MMIGRTKPVAVACDEEDEAGEMVRTWDVVYRDRCIASGLRTRREARAEAAREATTAGGRTKHDLDVYPETPITGYVCSICHQHSEVCEHSNADRAKHKRGEEDCAWDWHREPDYEYEGIKKEDVDAAWKDRPLPS